MVFWGIRIAFFCLVIPSTIFAIRAHQTQNSPSRPEITIDIAGSKPIIQKTEPFKGLFQKDMLVMNDSSAPSSKEPLGEAIENWKSLLSDTRKYATQPDDKNKMKQALVKAINQRVKNKITEDLDKINFITLGNTAFLAGHLLIEDKANKRLFVASKDGKGLISFAQNEVMNFLLVEKPKERLVIVGPDDKKYSAWFFTEGKPYQQLPIKPMLGHDFDSNSALVKFTYYQGEKGNHALELDADFDKKLAIWNDTELTVKERETAIFAIDKVTEPKDARKRMEAEKIPLFDREPNTPFPDPFKK